MRILIIVHLFYQDMWPELAACIASCPAPFDLIVTITDKESEARAAVNASFPNAKVELVKNQGFDVGPFIHVLNSVDLSQYDVVIKLHAKRDVHAKYIIGKKDMGKSAWREHLLRFCACTEHWKKTLSLFKDPTVGMVGEGSLALSPLADPVKNKKDVQKIFSRIGMEFRGGYFIAGTMFAVRADLLTCLQGKYHIDDFDKPNRAQRDCAPHFFERVFGYLVYSQGRRIISWDEIPFERNVFWTAIQRKVFHTHYGRHHIIYKCFGIPVWYKRWDRDAM